MPDSLCWGPRPPQGSVWLLVMACLDGSLQKIVSAAIYGVTLVLLYSVSTVYHSVRAIQGDHAEV